MMTGVSALLSAFKNSARGLSRAFRHERAVRQEICLLIVGILLAIFIAPSFLFFLLLIGSLLFILSIELLNTGIEKLCDHITPDHHETIGYIKDLGSAAVLCALLLAVMVWGYALVMILTLYF